MNYRIHYFFLILLVLALPACSGSKRNIYIDNPLTPFPEAASDPSNEILIAAIKDFLADSGAPISSRYEFSRVDLDGDNRRDALILFKNPYGYWCDMHGCTMLVMKAQDDHFELVNAIQPIRTPLYVSEIETNGWKDLIIRVSGRWDQSRDVAMQYDGRKYPSNPSALPPYLRFAANDITKLFP